MTEIGECIRRESTEASVIAHAEEICEAEARLRWLMDNAVDYTRVAAGRAEITPLEYSLKNLARDAQRSAQPLCPRKEVDFETEIVQSLPNTLYGDEPKLRQIIANLLINASAAEGISHVKLSVFGKIVDENTLHMLVSITTSREDNASPVPSVSSPTEARCGRDDPPRSACYGHSRRV